MTNSRVICIGSYAMRRVARRYGWSPGVFGLFEHDFTRQLAHWGQHLLNANSVVSALEDVKFTAEALFIRPVEDSKSFSGRVMTREEFEAWRRSVLGHDDGSTLTGRSQVQVSAPITIHAEYRLWVVRGAIVTRSLYKRAGRALQSREVDAHVDAFVAARVAEWQPHEAFVIDVCETTAGLKIVELNTLNAAGFYAADLQKLVHALEAAFG